MMFGVTKIMLSQFSTRNSEGILKVARNFVWSANPDHREFGIFLYEEAFRSFQDKLREVKPSLKIVCRHFSGLQRSTKIRKQKHSLCRQMFSLIGN